MGNKLSGPKKVMRWGSRVSCSRFKRYQILYFNIHIKLVDIKNVTNHSIRVKQELCENIDLMFLGAKLSRLKHKLEENSVSNLARF